MKGKNYINRIVRDFLDDRLTARQRRDFIKLVQHHTDRKELEDIYQKVFEQIGDLSDEEVEMLHVLLEKEQRAKGTIGHKIRPFLKYAAVLLMLCGLYFIYPWEQQSADVHSFTSSVKDDTAVSKHQLPDGSEVVLYGNSTFEVLEYAEQSRTILLHGEADFSVVPNKIPFFVKTESGYFTKVLGTKFRVRDVEGRYRVAVERGRVSVGKGDDMFGVLCKGDSLVADGNIQLYSVATNPLIFENVDLMHVVRSVNQAYDTEVALGEALDGQVKCTAVFEKHLSVIEIVDILCEMYGYTYTIEGQKIIIQS